MDLLHFFPKTFLYLQHRNNTNNMTIQNHIAQNWWWCRFKLRNKR